MAETLIRCGWRGMAGDPLYEAYHDTEWGVPEYDSRALWEKLVLDGFQASLAWITILRKRDAFRAAFDNFDPEKVAGYGETDRARLMADAGIVRSNAKIDADQKRMRRIARRRCRLICRLPRHSPCEGEAFKHSEVDCFAALLLAMTLRER